MQYSEILKSYLAEILEGIRQDIKNDENITEFIESKEELESLLDRQEELLKEYLYDFENAGVIDHRVCWNFYKDLNIPYSVVYKTLQTLKIALMERVLENLDDKSQVIEVEKYVNHLLNSVAHVYIKKDIVSIKDFKDSAFSKYLLFRAHLDWMEALIESVRKDDMSLFPLTSTQECSFSNYLQYPESMMVCMDANLCTHLHDLHDILHKSANTFYLFYKKADYVQAYVIFKELIETVMKFNKVVTELYFLAYGNAEESLFRYIELLLYHSDVDIYLTLIDIRKLKTLNTNFGELTINEVLKRIDSKLQGLIHQKEQFMLLVKGTTADYYMVSVGIEKEMLQRVTNEVYEITNNIYHVEHKEIEIKSIVATLSLNGFYGKSRDDLTRLILHLKEDAKQKEQHLLVVEETKKRDLIAWLDSSYKDIDFVSQKLKEKAVDVVFQPIFNIQTKEVDILEVLVRIKDKEKLIPAGRFIETIYAIGKIEELDTLVLQKLQEYKDDLKRIAKTLFINVSYKSIMDTRYKRELEFFIEEFRDIDVIYELTEQSIVENIDEVLNLHKNYNIHFAVDDFGSGYSSLKTVSDLSRAGILKVLKIDESMIKSLDHDIYDQKIVDIIAKLASSLELKSVGEFIENKEVLERLKSFGITYAQGYYLSKPKTVDELLVEKLNGLLGYKE